MKIGVELEFFICHKSDIGFTHHFVADGLQNIYFYQNTFQA